MARITIKFPPTPKTNIKEYAIKRSVASAGGSLKPIDGDKLVQLEEEETLMLAEQFSVDMVTNDFKELLVERAKFTLSAL